MEYQPVTLMQFLYSALFFLLLFPVQVLSMDLPRGHVLKQNGMGDYYVVNADKVTMIEPSIISIGHSSKWIVACISNVSIDSDPKRMVFINLKIGGTTDSINRENWENFKDIYPELAGITLEPLQDESCP